MATKSESEKAKSNQEILDGMEKNRILHQSFFSENGEAGKVKIQKGKKDPRKLTMLNLKNEFLLAQVGRLNTDNTMKTYETHFNRIFDFLGYQYLNQIAADTDDVDKNIAIREAGKSMPVIVLETDYLAAFYQYYLRTVKQVGEQTIVSSMRHYRAIVYFAQQQRWIKDFDVLVRDIQPNIRSLFTKYELEKLGRKPNKEDMVAYRCYVMIKYLCATGNRISSLLALDVRDVDFEEGNITVNVQKNKKPKLMPLNYDLRKVLREYIYHWRTDSETGEPMYNEPLFTARTGERLSYTGARDAMQDYFRDRGVEWEGFHKFRHSYAANWIRDGGNPFMLKEQLGHSSLAMTNRYANIYGMATKDEAEEHSLIKKMSDKTGRKSLKYNK